MPTADLLDHAPMEMTVVREISLAINAAHRITYLATETAEEAAKLGVRDHGPGGPAYFAFRSAAMGAVPWQVTLATFYNFSPRAVHAMAGVWDTASPRQWQSARFVVADRVLQRIGVHLSAGHITEARSLIDPVVARADYAGKPLAAANAAVTLPPDPLVALWQQITVLREWRGDAHLVVLADNRLGPCDCTVMQTATGRLPTMMMRTTRQWNDDEWAAATARLIARGWLNADGTVTDAGAAARERIEIETDEHCATLWSPIGNAGARRLAALIAPIDELFTSAVR
ncbi:MAG TPA: hypothetical protein VGE11_07815 [Pseudonocardia sp.]